MNRHKGLLSDNTNGSSTGPTNKVTEYIETSAIEMANAVGELLRKYPLDSLQVKYKDAQNLTDPVSVVDIEIQDYLSQVISDKFPSHGIIAEEGTPSSNSPLPDYIWVIDPIDGTTNFINGLPIYGVSIGVLYRGKPIVGVVLIPWPNSYPGIVVHARMGGGAWIGQDKIIVKPVKSIDASRLSGIPGSLGSRFYVSKNMLKNMGEIRVLGSICYEMALVATGILQYLIIGNPKIWDVAAGIVLINEAGGTVLISNDNKTWGLLDDIGPSWEKDRPTSESFRKNIGSLIAGSPELAWFVASNIEGRLNLCSRIIKKVRRFFG